MDNTNQPKPAHKTNWMVIILLIIICAIVAVGIWWWMQDTAKIASLEQQVAQSEVKINGPTVTPTATATATPTPSASTSVADKYAGWKTYTDDYYGYEVQYPKDWKVSSPRTMVMSTETNDFINQPHNGIFTVFEGPGNFDFNIITRKLNEKFSIGPTGIGWTDTEAGNKVVFSGTEIQKYYEIYYGKETKHSNFHYSKPGQKVGEKGNLIFTIGDREYILSCMHKNGIEYLNVELDQTTEDTVDKIVESFRLL